MPEPPHNKGLFRSPAPFQSGPENGDALSGAAAGAAGNDEARGSNNINNGAHAGAERANGLRTPDSEPPYAGQARLSSLIDYAGAPYPATPTHNPNPGWSYSPDQNPGQPASPSYSPGGVWNQDAAPIAPVPMPPGAAPNNSNNTWDQTMAHPNAGQSNGWNHPLQPLQPPQSPMPQNASASAQNWNQGVANNGQSNGWGQPPTWQNGGPGNFNVPGTAPNGWNQGFYLNGAPASSNGNNGWGQQGAYPGAPGMVPNGNGQNGLWGAQPLRQDMSWNQAAAHAARKRTLREKYAGLSTPKKVLLLVLVVALLIPSLLIVVEGIDGLILYSQVRSGMQHLQNAQALFSGGPKGNTAKYLDINKLRQAQVEIDAANSDFHQLSDKLDHDGLIGLLGPLLPRQISTARSLAHIGADAMEIAQQGVKSAITLSPTLTPALSHPLGGGPSTAPIVTPPVLDEIGKIIDFALPRLHDMQQYSHDLDLASLPLSDSQRKLIMSTLPVLPVGEGLLKQVRSNMDVLGWLLGVDQPRTFLVETMDRAELRATGGFTGQFGELALNGGRMAPLSLKNIGQFEEDNRATGSPLDPIFARVQGQVAPAPFTWWPIPNFGMRDANLSADFPTSAKLIMNQYKSEFGKQTDGLILFSPFLIAHVLQVTGPISVSEYNETISAQNLEARLHYYQLDNVGIRKEELVEHVEDPQIARKLFTKRLSSLLLAKVQALPTNELVNLGKEMLYAMKTRDLQVYFTNEKLEKLVGQYGSTAEIDRSTTHDGLYVVQANLSVSKASQYVTTSIADTVTLDAKGGATHVLKMKLVYNQLGSVYGLDTYRDYVRVYTPPSSQFISGTGFSHFGDPYCGGYYIACQPRQDVFGTGEMICPIGTKIGLIPALNDDPYGARLRPIDRIGAPLNMTSDEPGRNMFASWVVVPKNCSLNLSLSWYVPPTGHQPYDLLIQRQSSTLPTLDVNVVPAGGTCSSTKPGDLHYAHVQDGEDLNFILVNQPGGACSLQVKPQP
ncbi:MAG: hypothetical protein NVS2B12_21070 [Ktedonobacteraceae bacterium]